MHTLETTEKLYVGPADNNTRLDLFLAQKIPAYSRTFFKSLIEKGCVTLQDKSSSKASIPLRTGDIVIVQFPSPPLLEAPTKPVDHLNIEIIHQNEHFLIINKPASLTVHSPAKGNTEVTLVDWLLKYFHEIQAVGISDRPGIVHRLDKDTSGLMVIARNNYAHARLSDLFKNRQMSKTYLAVVEGHPPLEGTIDFKITRHPTNRIKMTHSFSMGREAVTHYRVQRYFKETALIEAKPITGRTHQIRVHCTAIGHSLVGDALYGSSSKAIKRQALHAQSLSFTFEGQEYHFSQNPPTDFQNLLQFV